MRMATRDPRVDAYIAASAPFARPILKHLRRVVHAGCPDVAETLKWGFPHFMSGGIVCSMAAFKRHCAFGFWKGSLIGADRIGDLKSIDDLPPKKELVAFAKTAAKLNEDGVKVVRPKKAPQPEAKTPPDLAAALKKNKKAGTAYDNFSPSHRREYVQWITEAKSDETRKRRLDQAVEWMAEGKPRNWKYMKK
jgi:hypothetical protein